MSWKARQMSQAKQCPGDRAPKPAARETTAARPTRAPSHLLNISAHRCIMSCRLRSRQNDENSTPWTREETGRNESWRFESKCRHQTQRLEQPTRDKRHLLVGVQVREVGEHVWRHGDPARLQLYLLSLFPVVQDAAAQPGDSREGSGSGLPEATPGAQRPPPIPVHTAGRLPGPPWGPGCPAQGSSAGSDPSHCPRARAGRQMPAEPALARPVRAPVTDQRLARLRSRAARGQRASALEEAGGRAHADGAPVESSAAPGGK